MSPIAKIVRIGIIAAILIMTMSITAAPVAAQEGGVPPGATITSATFSIYVDRVSNQTIRLHRITAPWAEHEVTWNNFGGAFDSAVEGSFVTDSTGWKSVDVTALVRAWQDSIHPNYGLLLEQGGTTYTKYYSSEWAIDSNRPKLDICYTLDTSDVTVVTIQRGGNGTVYDAYIWQLEPDETHGGTKYLWTGLFDGGEKQALLYFDFAGGTATAVNLSAFSVGSDTTRPWSALALIAAGMILLGGTIMLRHQRD